MELNLSDGDIKSWEEVQLLYNSALKQINTKIEILNDEFQEVHRYNPIEHTKSRIKTPESIVKKLKRHGYDSTLENMVRYVNDIAGIRIICSFTSDIYKIADMVSNQKDIQVLTIKDYIMNPKKSGYRSYHMIVAIPVYLSNKIIDVKCEIQIRTVAMDFWASLEHKMKYKKDIQDAEMITEDLCFSADMINQIDRRMQQIRERIDAGNIKENVSENRIDFSDYEITANPDVKEGESDSQNNEQDNDSKTENTIGAVLDAAKKQISQLSESGSKEDEGTDSSEDNITDTKIKKNAKKKVVEVEQSDPIFIASANAKNSTKKKSAKTVESSLR